MKDSYLWDGTGPPDPRVVLLEQALRVLRHRPGALPPLPARPVPMDRRRAVARLGWIAAAAALALIVLGAAALTILRPSSWAVRAVTGLPAVDGRSVRGTSRLGPGEWLITDGASRARLAVGRIGTVDVEPNSRVQVVNSGGREYRMTLDRGTIHARIWAPPRFFYVDTAAGVAVDLGCAYTLHAGRDGEGLLRVTHGWVGFERPGGPPTYVPEGAVCAMRAGRGAGTPRYEDAPSGYGEALLRLDFGRSDDPGRPEALDLILSSARRRDALTLWHLLSRGSLDERGRVYDRLAALVPPPDGVSREAILSGNGAALARWWDALGVSGTTWWRMLKKKTR